VPENPTWSRTDRLLAFGQKHATNLVTLLFTDLVDSTSLKQQLGEHAGQALLARHQALVRDCLKRFPTDQEISTAGDSFLLVFAVPSQAVTFSLLLLANLRSLAAEVGLRIHDRIGIHLGEVALNEAKADAANSQSADLHSVQIDICSRVMSMARGDQILLTRPVFDNARQVLKGEDLVGVGPLAWVSHGDYVLRGVEDPVEICEVGEQSRGPFTPPPTTEKSRRHVPVEGELILGWRPAISQQVPNTKWTLERQLGTGGFGEVWLAQHETLKERRVFKFCFRSDRVRALKREVTLFRLLKEQLGDHPQIVKVREVFFDEPPFYVVMDYAEGGDLRTWCEAQGGVEKVPERTRLELVAQAAEALQAAHRSGVIHRDIKPGNILIARSPANLEVPLVKLTDFGIGQVVAKELLDQVTRAGFTQTMLGAGSPNQTGTFLYMAPELLAGQPATARSDIYSLGVVLFQMIVGDFCRPLTMDWVKHVRDPLLREDLLKCFAGDPAERFGSAGELAQQLRAIEERRAAQAAKEAAVEARKRRDYLLGLLRQAALAVLVLALLASVFLLLKEYRAGRFGAIDIRTIPEGAEVWLKDQRVGATPYSAAKLAPGQLTFTVKLPGYQTLEGAIDVSSRKQTQFVAFLSPVRPDLAVQSLPAVRSNSAPGPVEFTNALTAAQTALRLKPPQSQLITQGSLREITAAITNRVTIRSIQGEVEVLVKGAEAWRLARAKMEVLPGDRLRTGRSSRATVLLSDNSVVSIGELSEFEITAPSEIGLRQGIIYFLDGGKTNSIQINTPSTVARIRG
jgi:class 3 adenylate cyclase/tRNA A-37 threonylcarbamoyl transferase component Bud32